MRIVVIGNGMVGYKFCEKLIARAPGRFMITVFGEEYLSAYDRVHLSEYFAGKDADDLSLAAPGWYADNNIDLHLGDPVTKIDRDLKIINSFHGVTIAYDILVFATGSSAMVPAIHGLEKKGVFVYHVVHGIRGAIAVEPQPKARACQILGVQIALDEDLDSPRQGRSSRRDTG